MKKLGYLLIILAISFSICACTDPFELLENEKEKPISEPQSQQDESPEEPDTEETEGPAFERIVIGFSGVDLPNPPYEESGIVYADLSGFSAYFGGTVSYNDEKTIAVVTFSSSASKYHIITFEAGKPDVSVTNLNDGSTGLEAMTVAPKQTESGLDISAVDFAALMGYSSKLENGVLKIYE